MRAKWPTVGLMTLLLVSCNGDTTEPPGDGPPEPPATTTVLEPPATTSAPDLPPIPSISDCSLSGVGRGERKCYVTVARAGARDGSDWQRATGLIREMMIEDQELINTSRNFAGAAETCIEHLGSDVPPFHVAHWELAALAETGFVLHDGGREAGIRNTIGHPSMLSFIGEGDGVGRLQQVHRSCTEPPDPFCGRTGVFQPTLKDFRATVHAHMGLIRDIDGRAAPLDGIRAFCEARGRRR